MSMRVPVPPRIVTHQILLRRASVSSSPTDGVGQAVELRAAKLARYRAKRAHRVFEKVTRYESRRQSAHKRVRIKGRFASHQVADTSRATRESRACGSSF